MMNRRHFLHAGAAAACTPVFLDAMTAEAATDNDTIVVAIGLSGGNDGLNTVIPLKQLGAYTTLRTPAAPPPGLALAYTEAELAPLAFDSNFATPESGATSFAFAPSMGAMRSLYGGGNLAVVAGVGFPRQELNAFSHQNAQLDWMTGQINLDLSNVPPGWLGVTLDGGTYGTVGPTASFYGTEQLIIGRNYPGLVIGGIDYFNVTTPETDSYSQVLQTLHAVLAVPQTNGAAAFDQMTARNAVAAVDTLTKIAKHVPANDYPAQLSYLDTNLRDVARMIIGKSGMRGYMVGLGSFDTHSAQNQGNYHLTLLQQLSYSMSSFYAYLKAKKVSQNVVIMTFSDFGRTPGANLNFGTDHGSGSVCFVLGDAVKGGVFGNYPSLTKLDSNYCLKAHVDFRNVLSDLIGFMGGNPLAVLGKSFPRLGFI